MVVYEQFGFLDVVGPADVFTTANQRLGGRHYAVQTVATQAVQWVTAESGMRLGVDSDIADVEQTHTLIVAGGLGFRAAMADQTAVSEIARLARSATRVASVCTGAFLLAEAGILDGRSATTHWAYADEFRSSFANVAVVADELYVYDGHVVTAAGVAAGIDLALALVADDHGSDLARETSRRMVLYLNRAGGQSQFSERLSSPTPQADPLDKLLAAVATDPVGDYTNAAMARGLSLSERHFSRLFAARTGASPARWVERVRVDVARSLIESSDSKVDSVAQQSGFGSVTTMRQAFNRVLGVTPSQYRSAHAQRSPDQRMSATFAQNRRRETHGNCRLQGVLDGAQPMGAYRDDGRR